MNRYILFLLLYLTNRSVFRIIWYRTNSEQLMRSCIRMLSCPSLAQNYMATVLLKVCQYRGNY